MMTLSATTTNHRFIRTSVRRGVSLVEVLVVLVVLIIGFAAMARLFPEGFASLGFTANATQAQAWMKFNEDRLRQAQENLPDAVVGIDPNTGLIRASITPQDLNTAFRQYPISGYSGTPPDDPRFADVNQARRVIGEHLDIPPPSVFAPVGEWASLYRPMFGPIYSEAALAPAALGMAAYSGSALRRVEFEDPPTPENFQALSELGDFGYGIDYDRARLYFMSTNTVRLFKIEFRYHGGPSVELEGAQENCFYLAANSASPPTTVTFDLRTAQAPMFGCNYVPLPATGILDRGTDFLYRRFEQIAVGTPFNPAEPYQFKVYDGILGLLGFNPAAATVPLPQQQGRGLSAQIDYDVDDWHILHDDTNVSLVPSDPDGSLASGGTASGDEAYVIKLAASAIKKLGDTEDTINFISGQPDSTNTFEYQGLQRYYPDNSARTGTPGVDLVIVDLETGLQIDSRTMQQGGVNSSGEIDYRSGIIQLWKFEGRSSGGGPLVWSPPFGLQGGSATGAQLDPAGRRVRIYFRTPSDMGVATFKPYNRYYHQPNLATLRQREYFPYNYGYVLLPPMDGEKTVAVDYHYVWRNPSDPSNASLYQLRKVVSEMHQVAPQGTPASPGLTPPNNAWWWVRAGHSDADPSKGAVGGDAAADTDVLPGSVVITGVRGA
ncbi:MAG: hypothetical protein ACO1SX_01015, partial [Actinomycetota bacterium]